MQIDIVEITSGDKWVDKTVWICDYRRPDLNKKPIRHVPPTKVLVRSNSTLPANKKIYYSSNHFVKLTAKGTPSSTIFPVFDNTGFRSFTGVPVNVFDNQKECEDFYNNQADAIIAELDKKIMTIVSTLTQERDEVLAQKI